MNASLFLPSHLQTHQKACWNNHASFSTMPSGLGLRALFTENWQVSSSSTARLTASSMPNMPLPCFGPPWGFSCCLWETQTPLHGSVSATFFLGFTLTLPCLVHVFWSLCLLLFPQCFSSFPWSLWTLYHWSRRPPPIFVWWLLPWLSVPYLAQVIWLIKTPCPYLWYFIFKKYPCSFSFRC